MIPINDASLELVDEDENENLKYILGLRMLEDGIPYEKDERIDKFILNGLIEKFGDRIRLTEKGMLLSNEVFVEFV